MSTAHASGPGGLGVFPADDELRRSRQGLGQPVPLGFQRDPQPRVPSRSGAGSCHVPADWDASDGSRLTFIKAWAGGPSAASSALSLRASALSAALEPLTPLLRKARRDAGFPCEASRRATSRPGSVSGCPIRRPELAVLVAPLWSWRGTALVLAAAPVLWFAMAAWPGPGLARSSGDEPGGRHAAAPPVTLSAVIGVLN